MAKIARLTWAFNDNNRAARIHFEIVFMVPGGVNRNISKQRILRFNRIYSIATNMKILHKYSKIAKNLFSEKVKKLWNFNKIQYWSLKKKKFLIFRFAEFLIFDLFEFFQNIFYHKDLEKQEGCNVVAHERLTEPLVTIEWLLAKPRSFPNILAF